MMTNYQSAVKRINDAKSKRDFERIGASLARCYGNGIFTEIEFMRLDLKLIDRMIELEQ